MSLAPVFRDDPELGRVRHCTGCGEDWPFDAEFWHIDGERLSGNWPSRCIACCSEYFAARRRLYQEIKRADRAIPPPVDGRCNQVMSGDRCGRRPGHGYAHRSTEAMASDRIRQRTGRAA